MIFVQSNRSGMTGLGAQSPNRPYLPYTHTASPWDTKQLPADRVDVRFGRSEDMPLMPFPYDIPIYQIPGLLAPAWTFKQTDNFLAETGYVAEILKHPGIVTGRKLGFCTRWLADTIDEKRIKDARIRVDTLSKFLARKKSTVAQLKTVQQFFDLTDDPQGLAIAKLALAFYKDLSQELTRLEKANRKSPASGALDKSLPGLLKQVQGLPMNIASRLASKATGFSIEHPNHFLQTLLFPKTPQQKLSTFTGAYRQKLVRALPKKLNTVQREKIANRIIDTLAPRAILLGHSMGGLTSLKTLQLALHSQHGNGDSGVGMVLGLGSPFQGVEIDESAQVFRDMLGDKLTDYLRPVVETTLAAIPDMERGSTVMEKVKNRPVPFDSTAIAVFHQEDKVVPPHAAVLPEGHPSLHNLEILSKTTLLSPLLPKSVQLFLKSPLGWPSKLVMDHSQAFSGLRQHCVAVDHCETHWSEKGEVLETLIARPDSPERLANMLQPENFEPLREHILELISACIEQDPSQRKQYQSLIPRLKEMAETPLPFINGSDKKAQTLLQQLQAPTQQ